MRTSTTDVLVELVHMWYKATDTLNSYVRVVMLDVSKAFDAINHYLFLDKLQSAHILRWMTAFHEYVNIPILVIPMGEYRKGHCLDLNISLFT